MSKVTLQEVGAGYSASTDLNTNNDALTAAIENTLSRDGTAPNEMEAQLDMNENRIINMADGVNPQDAVTLSQLTDLISGDGIVISVGEGTGIDVDSSTPSIPVVSLDAATIATLALVPAGLPGLGFITHTATAALTADRVLTAGTGITFDTSVAGLLTIDSSAASDHGALTGLSDDDHTQYAGIAQTETITGDWSFGANVIISDTFELVIGHTTQIRGDAIDVVGTAGADASIGLSMFAASSSGPKVELTKSRGASLGTNTIVQDNDILGSVSALGANGSSYSQAAVIEFRVDGTPGASNDMPGEIAFLTSPDATETPTERMSIDSTGAVRIVKDTQSTTLPPLRIGDSGATTVSAHLSIVESGGDPTLTLDSGSGSNITILCNGSFSYIDFASGFLDITCDGQTMIEMIDQGGDNEHDLLFYNPIRGHGYDPTAKTSAGATENNVASLLDNVSPCNLVYWTPAAGNTTVNGIAPSATYQLRADGEGAQVVTIVNMSAADNLIFAHENVGSTAANRFTLPAAGSVTLLPKESAMFVYVVSAQRWHLTART